MIYTIGFVCKNCDICLYNTGKCDCGKLGLIKLKLKTKENVFKLYITDWNNFEIYNILVDNDRVVKMFPSNYKILGIKADLKRTDE